MAVRITQVWNNEDPEGDHPEARTDDWTVGVYFDGKVDEIRKLGYWHAMDDGKRWWGRGLDARRNFDEIVARKLDLDIGILSGDDPRGLSFKAEMREIAIPTP